MPKWGYVTSVAGLVVYAASIVFGRLYCGMHSFTDCTAGVLLGTMIWAAQWTWGPLLDQWFSTPGWQVPLISVPLTLILVNQHPDPVDDCPCFEDAIAFLSVILGTTLAMWWRENWGYGKYSGFFVQEAPKEWVWWIAGAGVKMVVGVLIIFVFRLIAKPILHAVLPPIFRGLSTLFKLPNRRFYTPAPDYKKFPSEPILNHPIPSMIDLSSLSQESEGVLLPTNNGAVMGRKRGRSMYGEPDIKLRNGNGTSNGGEKAGHAVKVVVPEKEEEEEAVKVKHYDAEVLTKVIVYAGIGFVASGLTPVMFEMIGLGVYQSIPPVRS
ncbi:hypothetical protein FS837_006056 [Tulasnella sp. UAMH 9824]|nr:hypothetical protein FS837_006056 [Tulasnella sp. UAMH 9824]